jgi:hypothetical protein
MAHIFCFFTKSFDPVNRFLKLKSHYTPKLKGFPLINILFAISKFLSEDKTGIDQAPKAPLNHNIF